MKSKKLILVVCRILFLSIFAALSVLTSDIHVSAMGSNSKSAPLYPDFIMINGNIITVNGDFSIAQAVAVKDGKIVAVGSTRNIKRLKGKNTKVLNLRGATVLPGINDTHIHLGGFGLSRPPLVVDVGYPAIKSLVDIRNTTAARVTEVSPGDWITGWGWDRGFIEELVATPEDDWPTKGDIDPVSPDNPIAYTDFSGHVCWANSKALELTGITAATPDPPGGFIQKDKSGEPTGLLFEAASGAVRALIPPWTEEQRRKGILNAMAEVNSLGITSATEPGLGAEEIDMYNDLYNEGLFTVRMNLMVMGGTSLEQVQNVLKYVGTHTGFGNEWLQISGMKMLADGIPPSKTAFMYEDYIGGGHGQLLIVEGDTDEERHDTLVSMIKHANARGFQIGVHTTGDRGIDAVVDGFIAALKEHPWDARHYIIHTDFVTQDCAERMAKYGILSNVQSTIKWTIGNLMVGIVGEDMAAYQWPLRMILNAGIIMTNSSDASVTYPDWRQGVESAVLREDKATGEVSGTEQCITVEEAIRSYTINGAWQDHQEDIKGSVEVGKMADFCIIGRDILSVDPHDISDIPILMTLVGGKVVYNANPEHLYMK